MRALALTTLVFSFAFGCVTGPEPDDEVDDPAAKADGAGQPAGLYELVAPRSFTKDQPRIAVLDLRSDGTYFEQAIMPAYDGERGVEEEVREKFGTYKLTRTAEGSRYLRFYDGRDESSTWRWQFEMAASTKLTFIASSGEVAFEMVRADRPTTELVTNVKAAFPTAALTRIAEPARPTLTSVPAALGARARDLVLANEPDLVAASFTVSSAKVFVLAWGAAADRQVEVFARTSQLLARTETFAPLVWADLRP